LIDTESFSLGNSFIANIIGQTVILDLLLTEIPSVNIVKVKLVPKHSVSIKSRYISPSFISEMESGLYISL
jgi:hypothetical protein